MHLHHFGGDKTREWAGDADPLQNQVNLLNPVYVT
jgi:hypothetical protein